MTLYRVEIEYTSNEYRHGFGYRRQEDIHVDATSRKQARQLAKEKCVKGNVQGFVIRKAEILGERNGKTNTKRKRNKNKQSAPPDD